LKLVITSNNQHKLEEISSIFTESNLDVVGYKSIFPEEIEFIEDGLTFEENALKKVNALPDFPDCIFLADDSGLIVKSLNNEPGVYSARYAGGDTSTSALCSRILTNLGTAKDRSAEFVSVIALRFPDQKIKLARGIVKGQIITQMKGENGFGYDPIFLPDNFSKTFAEMKPQEKNMISHRYLALLKAKFYIDEYF
jgi:non-canonical purine NTP pyrophosphatase (RdgB/HAM1 family)